MTAPTTDSRRRETDAGRSRPHGPPALSARGGRLRGLVWLTLRVHRASLWGWAAFAVAATAGLLWLHDVATTSERWKGCGGTGRPACPPVEKEMVFGLFTDVITYLPFAVAAYAAGVLVARDLENGTAALASTQSVSPARWLVAKLAVPGLLVMGVTAVLTLLLRQVWSVGTQSMFHPWHVGGVFHSTGVISLAHVLLGLAVGALAGLLVRRTLPAMAVAAAAMLPVHLALGSLRFELWPRVFRTGYEAVRMSREPVQGEMGVIKEGGVRITDFSCPGVESPAGMKQCLNEQGAREVFADVHPASHFWPIQLVEAGIVLALAALVLWSAFRLLRRNGGTHAGSATVTSAQEGTA